jgi:uncharacterized membrane protein
VALLFLVSYSGHGFYGLYARNTAFVLMGVSTLVGAAVARRANLVSIAVLSLIGGNLAPLLLRGPEANVSAFLAYLLMLQVVALVLAWMGGGPKWWTLRGLSLAGNALWVLGVIWSPAGRASSAAELLFLIVSAALYQAELLASARRWNDVGGAGVSGDLEAANPGVIFSTLVTAVLTIGVLGVLRGWGDGVRGAWVAGIAAAAGVAAFIVPRRGARGIRAVAALGIGYRVQAAALVVLAVPVTFSGVHLEIGWCALAVAFAALAWKLDLRSARIAAVATWWLAVAHLQWRVMGSLDASARRAAFALGGVAVPVYVLVGWALATGGQIVAAMTARSRRGDVGWAPWIATIGGTVLWVVVSIAGLPALGATLALIVYAWLMIGIGEWVMPARLAASVQGAAVLALATVKWVLIDLLAQRLSASWAPAEYAAVMTPAMGLGCALAASLAALFWLRRQTLLGWLRRWGLGDDAEREGMLIVAGVVIALMTIGLSFEIDRLVELQAHRGIAMTWPAGQLKQLLFTMLWPVAACAQLALVRGIEPSSEGRSRWLGRIGWVPVAVGVKFLLVDAVGCRVAYSPASAMPVLNLQVIAALCAIGGLAAAAYFAGQWGRPRLRSVAGFTIALMLLCVGGLEIDRAFERLAVAGAMGLSNAMLAKQLALSIFGAVFAIASVAAGFPLRAAALRYFGLALFAMTLIKVVFVDLSTAGQGYRVLSFLGLGLLMLGTSVLYGKLSPKLLGRA